MSAASPTASPFWQQTHVELIRARLRLGGRLGSGSPVSTSSSARLRRRCPLGCLGCRRSRRATGRWSHPADSFSYDIFSQAGQAIRDNAALVLGGLSARAPHRRRRVAVGRAPGHLHQRVCTRSSTSTTASSCTAAASAGAALRQSPQHPSMPTPVRHADPQRPRRAGAGRSRRRTTWAGSRPAGPTTTTTGSGRSRARRTSTSTGWRTARNDVGERDIGRGVVRLDAGIPPNRPSPTFRTAASPDAAGRSFGTGAAYDTFAVHLGSALRSWRRASSGGRCPRSHLASLRAGLVAKQSENSRAT